MKSGIIITLIQSISFLSYFYFVWKKYGRLLSLSHSYYMLSNNMKWLFTIVMYIVAVGQCIHSELNVWFFVSGIGMAMIGAANSFQDTRMTYYVHLIGTVVAILFSVIGIYIYSNTIIGILLGFVLAPGIVVLLNKRYWIWNIELYFMIAISITIILLYSV